MKRLEWYANSRRGATTKFTVIALAVFAVAIGGALVFYAFTRNRQTASPATTSVVSAPEPYTPKQVAAVLLPRSKLTFPAIVEREAVRRGIVPVDILAILDAAIDQTSTDQVYEAVRYADGRGGYHASILADYQLDWSYVMTLSFLRRQPGWRVDYGSEANLFAFLDTQSPSSIVRVTFSVVDKSHNTVDLSVMNK
jgi:hypothetical protein